MPTVKLYIAGPKSNRPNFNSFVFFRVVEFEPFNLLSLQAINPTSLNLDLGMVTSCCGCQKACWRPACWWLRRGSMSIGDPHWKPLGWKRLKHLYWSWNIIDLHFYWSIVSKFSNVIKNTIFLWQDGIDPFLSKKHPKFQTTKST